MVDQEALHTHVVHASWFRASAASVLAAGSVAAVNVESIAADDGYSIAFHRLGGTGPTLLFVHAASLCAAMFEPLAVALADDFSCVAPDLRGHGRSARLQATNVTWSRLGDDVTAIIDHLEGPIYGFGHSLGATALLVAAARRGGRLQAVIAYEPVILVGADTAAFAQSQAARSERRHAKFPSIDDARDRLGSRPPLDRVEPSALEGYLRDGFLHHDDGSVSLVLDPVAESALYRAGIGVDFDSEFGRLSCPVTLVTGEQSEHALELGARHLSSVLSNVSLRTLPGGDHFGPLEDARKTAQLIIRAFEATAA